MVITIRNIEEEPTTSSGSDCVNVINLGAPKLAHPRSRPLDAPPPLPTSPPPGARVRSAPAAVRPRSSAFRSKQQPSNKEGPPIPRCCLTQCQDPKPNLKQQQEGRAYQEWEPQPRRDLFSFGGDWGQLPGKDQQPAEVKARQKRRKRIKRARAPVVPNPRLYTPPARAPAPHRKSTLRPVWSPPPPIVPEDTASEIAINCYKRNVINFKQLLAPANKISKEKPHLRGVHKGGASLSKQERAAKSPKQQDLPQPSPPSQSVAQSWITPIVYSQPPTAQSFIRHTFPQGAKATLNSLDTDSVPSSSSHSGYEFGRHQFPKSNVTNPTLNESNFPLPPQRDYQIVKEQERRLVQQRLPAPPRLDSPPALDRELLPERPPRPSRPVCQLSSPFYGRNKMSMTPQSSTPEDRSEPLSAPSEYLAEFLSAIMSRNYAEALKYCKLILQFEPDNATARGFYELLEQRVGGGGGGRNKRRAHRTAKHGPSAPHTHNSTLEKITASSSSESGSSSARADSAGGVGGAKSAGGAGGAESAGEESEGSSCASLSLDSSRGMSPSPSSAQTNQTGSWSASDSEGSRSASGSGSAPAGSGSGSGSGDTHAPAGTAWLHDDNGNPTHAQTHHSHDEEDDENDNAAGGDHTELMKDATLRDLRAQYTCSIK